jgi:ribosome-associated protein
VSDDDGDADLRSRGEATRERKADEKKLAALAKALVSLSSKRVDKLKLDEGLAGAIHEATRMRSHAARGRQMRIVRRELRASDSVAIGSAVHALINPNGRPTLAVRAAQKWADRFLADGDDAVEAFLAEHALADRQRLKGLLRNVQKADASKESKARKNLVALIQLSIPDGDT